MHFVIDFEMLFLYTSYCRSVRVEQGRLAQLGEHLPYKQGVIGSSPIVPTKDYPPQGGIIYIMKVSRSETVAEISEHIVSNICVVWPGSSVG